MAQGVAGKGFFVAPVLLQCSNPEAARAVNTHEVFGPVATICVYDGSGRVSQIKDPLNLALTLSYGANGLASVQDPGNPARTTTITVDGTRSLTAITDPDNVSTNVTDVAA